MCSLQKSYDIIKCKPQTSKTFIQYVYDKGILSKIHRILNNTNNWTKKGKFFDRNFTKDIKMASNHMKRGSNTINWFDKMANESHCDIRVHMDCNCWYEKLTLRTPGDGDDVEKFS